MNNKAIMISIQPQWVEKILNGEKTIEIRKTMPKCKLPIDVYIYCTKSKRKYLRCVETYDKKIFITEDKDILGRTEKVKSILGEYATFVASGGFNGKVVAKFTLNKVEPLEKDYYDLPSYYIVDEMDDIVMDNNELSERSCLDETDLARYLKCGDGYVWHIDNLEIFDVPKELSEFKIPNPLFENVGMFGWAFDDEPRYISITKAPQGWCYVEVEEDE